MNNPITVKPAKLDTLLSWTLERYLKEREYYSRVDLSSTLETLLLVGHICVKPKILREVIQVLNNRTYLQNLSCYGILRV